MTPADSLEVQSPAPAADRPAASKAAAQPAVSQATAQAPQSADAAVTEPAPSAWSPEARSRLTNLTIVILVITAAVTILYAWQLPPFGGRYEQTDNAYVRGQTTIISPQVSGYVADVPVQDFQNVQTGQVLVRIEDQ